MKRALATGALLAGLALVAAVPAVSAQTADQKATQDAASTGEASARHAPDLPMPTHPTPGSWYGATAKTDAHDPQDDMMRTMYVSMGAMAGYMFAVMPVTTAAITAAVASGAASWWAYDYLIAPAGAPVAPAR